MGENSKIEWTDDTVSLWWGCTRYGEGCRHCYAEKLSKRSGDFWGPQARRLRIKSAVAECERLNRKAEREGKPRLVFINSMSDFFEQHDGPVVDRQGQRLYNFEGGYKLFSPTANVGGIKATTLDDLRREAFETFACCQRLRFLLLTKRPENIRRMWLRTPGISPQHPGSLPEAEECRYRQNVWLGCSIATQADADRNIPLLLECRDLAPVLFLSCEPLLERVAFGDALYEQGYESGGVQGWVQTAEHGIDWVIVGGESGHGARPCHPDWVRSIREQCRRASVPFFFKQWGEWREADIKTPQEFMEMEKKTWTWLDRNGESGFTFGTEDRACMVRVGKKAAGRLLDGVEYSEFPAAVTT